ncbi:MAG: Hsp20/alpha crystallin family protein [Ignavibacteria bacterium]|nr:Hsp20/alpha crystallin family protein [Ignavibacteria bacterium]
MAIVKFKRGSEPANVNDAFRSLFNFPFFSEDRIFDSTNFSPRTRITEDKDNYNINIEMPGVTKDEVKISLENNVLSISGQKKQQTKSEDTNLIMNEIYYGEFCRTFTLSDDIKKDTIDAEFKDGVLNITLPKVEEAKPVVKEIKVK